MTTLHWRHVLVAGLLVTVMLRAESAAQPRGGGGETLALQGFLRQAQYQANTRVLTLSFTDGSQYQYAEVPQRIFDTLKKSPADATSIFNTSIRDRFKTTQLKPSASAAKKPEPPDSRRTSATPAKAAATRRSISCPSEMPKRDVVSRVLDAVSYDPATRCLVLYFDSRHVYRYGNVPPEVYKQLLAPNANYNSLIRTRPDGRKFEYEKIG